MSVVSSPGGGAGVSRFSGPDELRYLVYRSAFNKVIGRATDYRRLLLAIKAEYDDIIRELRRREDEGEMTSLMTSHPTSLTTCQGRANQLRDRISEVQRETSGVEEQLQVSGVRSTEVLDPEVLDPEVLDRRRQQLQVQRSALLCVKGQRSEVKAELQTMATLRNEVEEENQRLRGRFSGLRCVCEQLSRWEGEGEGEGAEPLQQLVTSCLEKLRQNRVDDEAEEEEEEEEPTGVEGAEPLTDYLDRLCLLCDSSQLEAAAVAAARSPGGVLRSSSTMRLFTAMQAPPPPLPPPPLLFFRALLVSSPPGVKLSASLSVEGVASALQRGAWPLLVHAVTHNKLSCSERLGDVLTEHAQTHPGPAPLGPAPRGSAPTGPAPPGPAPRGPAPLCLALAAAVYQAAGRHRKSALSMCSSGREHDAAEVMKHHDFTTEDGLWVLCRSPSLSLLQLMTHRGRGQAHRGRGQGAVLSVGVACSTLLAHHQRWELATALLDDLTHRGVLRAVVLGDSVSLDVWVSVASQCCERGRADLRDAVLSVLLDLDGTGIVSPDLEGAELMDHVLL